MRFTEEEWRELEKRRSFSRIGKGLTLKKPRKGDPEHQEQKALIVWCDVKGHPFNRLFAIPNGGGRSKMEAGKLKAEGVRAGVPDLFLPVPSGPYHGLFIEMKAERGHLREEQAVQLEQLAEAGYYCVVAYGWEQAKAVLVKYVADFESLPPMPVFHGTRHKPITTTTGDER